MHGTQIEKRLDPAQQMVVGNVVIEAKIVKKPIRRCLLPHHRQILRGKSSDSKNHAAINNATDFFNTIGQEETWGSKNPAVHGRQELVQRLPLAETGTRRRPRKWKLVADDVTREAIKIGDKVVHHGRYVTCQLVEVAVPWNLFRNILLRIDDLRRRLVTASAERIDGEKRTMQKYDRLSNTNVGVAVRSRRPPLTWARR